MVATDVTGPPVQVHLFRDHDPVVMDLPGMDLGQASMTGDPHTTAARWFDDGVRMVTLPTLVDLTEGGPQAARCLALIRELTSYGIAVRWRLQVHGWNHHEWWQLRHLYPPTALKAANRHGVASMDHALANWRKKFRVGLFHYRKGPGFILVRDFRSGTLQSTTIDDATLVAAVPTLERYGACDPEGSDIAGAFEAQHLVARVGDQLLWLPHRLRRWPMWLNSFVR